MTLMLTPKAAETIRLLLDSPEADGVRISHAESSLNGGAAGLQIAVVPAPEPGDAVIEAEGARLFLDAGAEGAMEDKVLHADVEGTQVRFELLQQADDGPRA